MHIRTPICALTVLEWHVAAPHQRSRLPLGRLGAGGDSWTIDAATDPGGQSDETDAPRADAHVGGCLADTAKDNDIAADDAEAHREPQDADIAGADDIAEPPMTLNGSTPQVPWPPPPFGAQRRRTKPLF